MAVAGLLSAWLIVFENLESFGIKVDTSEGAEAWLKAKRTAAIKRLTVTANNAFKVRRHTLGACSLPCAALPCAVPVALSP